MDRIDNVAQLRRLGRDSVLRIVGAEIEEAGARTGLARRNLRLRGDRADRGAQGGGRGVQGQGDRGRGAGAGLALRSG